MAAWTPVSGWQRPSAPPSASKVNHCVPRFQIGSAALIWQGHAGFLVFVPAHRRLRSPPFAQSGIDWSCKRAGSALSRSQRADSHSELDDRDPNCSVSERHIMLMAVDPNTPADPASGGPTASSGGVKSTLSMRKNGNNPENFKGTTRLTIFYRQELAHAPRSLSAEQVLDFIRQAASCFTSFGRDKSQGGRDARGEKGSPRPGQRRNPREAREEGGAEEMGDAGGQAGCEACREKAEAGETQQDAQVMKLVARDPHYHDTAYG